MAYKFKAVTVNNWSALNEALRDFLVTDVGWTDETPAGQDDEMGAGDFHSIIGHFLRSDGEDGNQDVCVHLGAMQPSDYSYDYYRDWVLPPVSYLSSGIGTGDVSATVDDGTEYSGVPTAFVARIDDELVDVSVVAGNVLTIARGKYGTTPATHTQGAPVLCLKQGKPVIDVCAFQDLSNAVVASSGTGTLGTDSVTNVPGLSGYRTDQFNWHGMLRVVDGPHAGKMRPILDYVSAGGDFTYAPFLTTPGVANVDVVSMGFLPTMSRRIGEGTTSYLTPRVNVENAGTDTPCWFYGSKDAFWVITKVGGTMYVMYTGNLIPFASRDTTISVGTTTAGTNTIMVANRHLFTESEKFRILSQNYADWATNQDRSAAGEDDLDIEEIPSEEFVVQSITPGTGDAGTLMLSANLQYTYSAGAVIGEDPRPAASLASGYQSIHYVTNLATTDCWLPVYFWMKKDAISAHATHRQTSRSVHVSGDPTTPDPVNLASRGRGLCAGEIGPDGIYASGGNDSAFYGYVNDRPTLGLWSLTNQEVQEALGIVLSVKGTFHMAWWIPYESGYPFGMATEDTVKARWGSGYEEFRLFGNNMIFGPEIS